MKRLVLITSLLIVFNNVFSQDFSIKPFTLTQKWVRANKSISLIKKEKPTGYVVASEEPTLLVLEKKQENNVIYDIKFFYTDNLLTGIMFVQHYARVPKLMGELEELGFTSIKDFQLNGIESIFYKNESNEGALLIINEGQRIVTCTFSKKVDF